jgi:ribonucleoside-diphosphate reductase beta chain
VSKSTDAPASLLDPGMCLTLRPMRYPQFYEMMNNGEKNTWTVEEVEFQSDLYDLAHKLSPAERHMIKRLVAFFATGDSIVSNNLVLSLYKHLNSPEARLFLSRQLWEEALHVKFYLTLLDNYIPDHDERAEAFAAVDNIPSIQKKAEFCNRWTDTVNELGEIDTHEKRKIFLLNLVAFAGCVEGMFFFAAFAYVYWFRSKGLMHGLATGTNYIFRDESTHMHFAFQAIDVIRDQHPELFDADFESSVHKILEEAIECEYQFALDLTSGGVAGINATSMRQYLEYIADQRLIRFGFDPVYNVQQPFDFMELQDVQELTNFFERRPSAYQVAVAGAVGFDEDF